MRSKGVGFSQDLKKSKFERARDSRGFGIELEAWESQQRDRRILAILCTKNEIKIHHTRAQKRGDWFDSKSPEGTRRIGPPFPIKSNTRSQQSMDKIYSKEKKGGRLRGNGLGERTIHGQVTKATRSNTSEGVFIPAETGQNGATDRSDRLVCSIPLYTIPSDG